MLQFRPKLNIPSKIQWVILPAQAPTPTTRFQPITQDHDQALPLGNINFFWLFDEVSIKPVLGFKQWQSTGRPLATAPRRKGEGCALTCVLLLPFGSIVREVIAIYIITNVVRAHCCGPNLKSTKNPKQLYRIHIGFRAILHEPKS